MRSYTVQSLYYTNTPLSMSVCVLVHDYEQPIYLHYLGTVLGTLHFIS